MSAEFRSIDATDITILEVLQSDGRISNKALARRIGLSPSACLERVRALQRAGVISRFTAIVAPDVLGGHTDAWIAITLPMRTPALMRAVTELLRDEAIVTAAYAFSAPFDVVARIIAPDLNDWRRLERQLEETVGATASVRFAPTLSVLKQPALPSDLLRQLAAGVADERVKR